VSVTPFRACVLAAVMLACSISATPAAKAADTNDAVVQRVVKLLGNEDAEMRGLALEQVRYYTPGEKATKQFTAALAKLPADAQVALLRALADRGDASAHAAVLRLTLYSKEEAVEAAAVDALGSLGSVTDIPLLVQKLGCPSKGVQGAAKLALVDLHGEDVPKAIGKAIEGAPAASQVTLLYVLSDRRAVDAIPYILVATRSNERNVREAAMATMGWIASPKWVPDMVPAVLAKRDKQERAAAEKAIMKVCSRVGNPDDRAKPLIAALKDLNETDRLRLLSTMGRVGGAAALAEIDKAIASDDARTHETGLKALSNWPSASIAPRYIELIKTETKPANRLLALRALIRVAPLRDRRSHAERLELLKKAMELSSRREERILVLDRARAVRTIETLRFVAPLIDDEELAEQACLTVVELAHHRGLREPNKAEFHAALDKVIATSKDAVVVERANRYKADKTWVRS